MFVKDGTIPASGVLGLICSPSLRENLNGRLPLIEGWSRGSGSAGLPTGLRALRGRNGEGEAVFCLAQPHLLMPILELSVLLTT